MKKLLFTLIACVVLYTSCIGQAIPTDKILHFSIGYVIGATTTSLLEERFGKTKAIFIGFGISSTVGLVKELLFDQILRKGTTEFKDLGVTMLGGLSGSLVITINL